jgi:WXG100 family type VII secretion target
MNNFVGMDPHAVRQVGVGFKNQSHQVNAINGAISSLVHQAQSAWHGGDSTRFAQSWSSRYRPQMEALREWLDQMATAAAANATQQEQTSQGGSRGHAAPSGHGGGLPGWLTGASDYGKTLLGLADKFSANRFVTGDYTKMWHHVLNWGDGHGLPGDLLRFKRSPVLQDLNKLHGLFGAASKIVGGLSLADHLSDAYADIASGRGLAGAGDLMHSVSDGMGLVTKATPVTYLGGVALNIWGDNLKLIQDTDWSYAPETWDYIQQNPGVVVEEFGHASVEVFKKLPGWFL